MFESKSKKKQEELVELMIDNLRGQMTVFYLTVLLEGSDEPAVISSKMLERPFNSYIDTRYTCIWGKKLKRILGVAKTQEQAEAIKLHYEVDNTKEFYYVVLGTYPNTFIDKREYVAQDTYNYCLRGEHGNIDIISKDKVFDTMEKALARQNELIQQKDNPSLKAGNDIRIQPSVVGTTTFSCTYDKPKKHK